MKDHKSLATLKFMSDALDLKKIEIN